MSRPAVIVMIKVPRAGFVKTRLTPALSDADAAALAVCLAQDAVNSASRVASEVIIAYAPSDGRDMLEASLPNGLHWLEQRGRDLGERLEAITVQAFEMGFGPLVFIGADSPTLPPVFIATAIRSLAAAESDIALGPTEDGGFYLVGLRIHARGIFRHIAWSTSEAYAQTARNAARLGLRLLELPLWYDVDTPSDLQRLRAELSADEEARLRAPATYQWLRGK
ncbi:MAG TPA: TIGR04282 family arsenosugar biosynthesis glycosyltransferase [Pyrinomonadaceae bacterium]|nr:TIGR04282 family arsenosugar biosynthesis glycosyltransferase [Pyrinomonadaceae bacterium]